MPVRASFCDKGEWESVNTAEEERSNWLKREVWDVLLSADGTIIRSELQLLNDRAGGQMENASPLYISVQKLGHVCEWLESNNHCWCLHPCSTADRINWKTVCVLELETRKTRKVRNWGRTKGAKTKLYLPQPPLLQLARSEVLFLHCTSPLPFEDWPPHRQRHFDPLVLASAVCKHANKPSETAGIMGRNNLSFRLKSRAFDFRAAETKNGLYVFINVQSLEI